MLREASCVVGRAQSLVVRHQTGRCRALCGSRTHLGSTRKLAVRCRELVADAQPVVMACRAQSRVCAARRRGLVETLHADLLEHAGARCKLGIDAIGARPKSPGRNKKLRDPNQGVLCKNLERGFVQNVLTCGTCRFPSCRRRQTPGVDGDFAGASAVFDPDEKPLALLGGVIQRREDSELGGASTSSVPGGDPLRSFGGGLQRRVKTDVRGLPLATAPHPLPELSVKSGKRPLQDVPSL
ncbi:hypothetical protein EJB05_25223, partial [Eragrostis curvula]